MPKRLALEHIKACGIDADAALPFHERTVYIWSEEHRAYWRPDSAGYTTEIESAGLYPFEKAYDTTRHCGPEKKIYYELVDLRPKVVNGSVADIGDDELLRRAVKAARVPHYRKGQRHPRWEAVGWLFALGSTYSHELCRRFDLHPDEEVKR